MADEEWILNLINLQNQLGASCFLIDSSMFFYHLPRRELMNLAASPGKSQESHQPRSLQPSRHQVELLLLSGRGKPMVEEDVVGGDCRGG